jgi:hypothetical protein
MRVHLSLALGERVAAGRVRVNPRELLLKNVQTLGDPKDHEKLLFVWASLMGGTAEWK